MVHISAIKLIRNFIQNRRVTRMKKWSTRNLHNTSPRYTNYKNLCSMIKNLLGIISGNDIVAMLKGF